MSSLSRRDMLSAVTLSAGAALATQSLAAETSTKEPFRYCFNTSTIRGQKLPITEVVDITAKAGYSGIEPWIRELDAYVMSGGSLADLGKRIRDQGLTVESAIGFAEWVVDDDERRKKGLETAKRDMDMLVQIGGKRIAAPPAGATDVSGMDLLVLAQRYHALLEVGRQAGIVPQVELWGFSKTLNRLGQVMLVAVESGHSQACVLADVYHLYKGGSDFSGMRLLGGDTMQVFHVNDYPANPPRSEIKDANRVYPGDGVAPLGPLFRDLYKIGFRGALSLELFNPDYWQQDALTVARTGLEKTRASVQKSFET